MSAESKLSSEPAIGTGFKETPEAQRSDIGDIPELIRLVTAVLMPRRNKQPVLAPVLLRTGEQCPLGDRRCAPNCVLLCQDSIF